MPPLAQRVEHRRPAEPRAAGQQRRIVAQRTSVRSCVGNNQQEVVDWVVAQLEMELTLESLTVADAHLHLERRAAPVTGQLSVPRSLFGNAAGALRQRHLCPIHEWRGCLTQDPHQPFTVCRVTDGVRARIEPDHEIEPQNSSDLSSQHDWEVAQASVLDPAVCRPRYPDAVSHMTLADTDREALVAELAPNFVQ